MCDDQTEADDAAWLSRRAIVGGGAAFGMAAILPYAGHAQPGGVMVMAETVRIPMPDGVADAHFVRPTRGRYPAVLMWPDIAGVRGAYERMAGRLAASGFAVLIPNQYYRSAPAPHFETNAQWRTPEGRARLAPMIAQLTPDAVERDAIAYVAWLQRQRSINRRTAVGTVGYCQGGAFALRTAAAARGAVDAAVSFHGANLVVDAPDSPHELLRGAIQANVLIAIAQNDDQRAPAEKDILRAAAAAAPWSRTAEIEVYPAQHGWCTIDSPVYAEAEAERAWARMLALFASAL